MLDADVCLGTSHLPLRELMIPASPRVVFILYLRCLAFSTFVTGHIEIVFADLFNLTPSVHTY